MNKKYRVLLTALLAVLALCLLGRYAVGHLARNSSFWYGNDDVLAPHREDFSAQIDPIVTDKLGADTEVLKVYRSLSDTMWFLMEDFEDFSQVVENRVFYIVPTSDWEYEAYRIDENGALVDSGGASTDNKTRPYGLHGLNHRVIQEALSGIDYEDYIITDSAAVIVWVRRESEDLFLTYPTRPDLMGIEVGEIYTLEELKAALAKAYHNES